MGADDLPEAAAPGALSPPPGLVVIGHFDQSPGYAVDRPGGADSRLFTWTTAGRGRLRQGGTETSATTGDLVVLAPGVRQGYGAAPGTRRRRFWWAHCRARPSWRPWLRPYDRGDGVHVIAPLPTALHGRVESAFRRMLADARWTGAEAPPASVPTDDRVAVAHGAAAHELALCALEEIVLLAASAASAERIAVPPPGVDARVRRAQALIAADPGAPHTVRSLAGAVALSPSRFAHLFAEQTGESPMRSLRESRLRHAARLLEGTDLSVARVATASGFAGPFHFSRLFHARFESPPGAYRAAHR